MNDKEKSVIDKINRNQKFKIWRNFFIFTFILLFVGRFFSVIFLSNGFRPVMNEYMSTMSYYRNKVPIWNDYTHYLKRYEFYQDFQYEIDNGFMSSNGINSKWIDFYFKCSLEMFPLFIRMFLTLIKVKKSIVYRYYGKNSRERDFLRQKLLKEKDIDKSFGIMIELNKLIYPDTKERYKKQISNPMEKMEEIFITEGVSHLIENGGKQIEIDLEKNYRWEERLKQRRKILDRYLRSLYRNIDKYLYEEDNYMIDEFGNTTNRELYFPSLQREVSIEEFKYFSKVVMYFYLRKLNAPIKIHQFAINIEGIPLEVVKMCKWISSEQRITVFNTEIRREGGGTRNVKTEVYYRIYRFFKYIGARYKHCEPFLVGEGNMKGIEELHRITRRKKS